MKILLVSEGRHEQAGALETLVRRVQPRLTECTQDSIRHPGLVRWHGKGRGFFKVAVRWMIEARKRGFDAVVLVTDEDGYGDRIMELDNAQREYIASRQFPRAVGIAIRTFDAWMLADERALSQALGVVVQKQPAPEETSHPKEDCAQLLAKSGCGLGQSDMYASIAHALDLSVLEKRCRKGFGTFADRLRRLGN